MIWKDRNGVEAYRYVGTYHFQDGGKYVECVKIKDKLYVPMEQVKGGRNYYYMPQEDGVLSTNDKITIQFGVEKALKKRYTERENANREYYNKNAKK